MHKNAKMTNEAQVLLRNWYTVGHAGIWVEVRGNATDVLGISIDTVAGVLVRAGKQAPCGFLGREAHRQLVAYFAHGEPLDLPLWDHQDKPNQVAAMNFLVAIPRGETRSYGAQAAAVRSAVGGSFNSRNAGNANHKNHYPLAIPCHRVVRASGDVGGFMGSDQDAARALKQALLAHEAAYGAL